jgi:hypothetical protein
MKSKACEQCPWRLANQGTRHAAGFYTARNLRRLWNQIRKGGAAQSCHLTDPSHPDHVAAGAKPGATAQECPGSVVLVTRELNRIKRLAGGAAVDAPHLDAYRRERPKHGLTRRGLTYWLVQRIVFGRLGGPPLPDVEDDPAIDLPAELREG